ncbi:MAG: hypothetical protein KGI00_00255 [Candidatus Micrarchaeota archaeon]|nr:hypothetical protein [Candidatus Micrarchaeota archaeon]MDE1823960.1 hypothetical protein [Candidatus Micrarchaeota archaeon]MDE1849146.1 hypothetical protein [Candidatus Micrarchaeota archaeon]
MGMEENRGFARKVAQSDGLEHYTDETEDRDLVYLIENSCISCSKAMKDGEVKIVPPRYVQDRDRYVRDGIVSKRTMCVPCYNDIKSRTPMSVYKKPSTDRARLVRSLLKGMLSGR